MNDERQTTNYPADFPSVLIPHYVSDEGNMFFKDECITVWATKKNLYGVELPTVKAWRVETPSNGKFYILTDAGLPIFESRDQHDCCRHIDLMKASTQFKVKL